jgi:hypothetical protein
LETMPFASGKLRSPIEFPPSDSRVSLLLYPGGDWPNPLTSCPGHATPTGVSKILPILGRGTGPDGIIRVSEVNLH